MRIRQVLLEDEQIIRDWLKSPIDCEFVTGKQTYSAELFNSWYHASDQHGYILVDDSNFYGYGEIWVDEQEGDLELAHLMVSPSYRNRGLGKKLISELLSLCKEFPYEWIYMRINPENLQAIRCYKGVGFKEDADLGNAFNHKWVWMKKRNDS